MKLLHNFNLIKVGNGQKRWNSTGFDWMLARMESADIVCVCVFVCVCVCVCV